MPTRVPQVDGDVVNQPGFPPLPIQGQKAEYIVYDEVFEFEDEKRWPSIDQWLNGEAV